MNRYLHYLVVPGLAAVAAGVVLLFLRLGIEGIVGGAFLFVGGLWLLSIGATHPARPRAA